MEELLGSFERPHRFALTRRFFTSVSLQNAAILLVAFGFGIAAMAYSDGVPGDTFYNAKRAAEQPAKIVDRDLIANNRIGELEKLIDRGADPNTVLTARTDAARALLNTQSDDPMQRALSLLAWPGGLHGRGVDADATNGALVISESEWFSEHGYTASLADGHLVTISAVDGEILIGTTGDWTVLTTGTGRQLTNDGVEQVYFIQRQGQKLRVSSAGRPTSSGAEDAAGPVDDPAGRSQFGDPPGLPDESGSGGVTADSDQNPTPQNTTVAGRGSQGAANSTATSRPQPGTTATTSAGNDTTSTTRRTASSTTTAPTTTTTTRPTTTVSPVVAWSFYLENPGTGNTSSSSNLPLSAGSAPGGSLGNFDTNRDGDPGLLIQKDGGGLAISDSTKNQKWTWTNSGATTFSGEARLTIWLAAQDFKDDERIGLLASIELCDPGCTRLGTAQWSGSASGGFRKATISFGSVSEAVSAGATLRLKVVVPDSLATTDVMFAYDSAFYPSRLSIG